MTEFRIRKVTKGNAITYYPERFRKFLWFSWWSSIKHLRRGMRCDTYYSGRETLQEAKDDIKRFKSGFYRKKEEIIKYDC